LQEEVEGNSRAWGVCLHLVQLVTPKHGLLAAVALGTNLCRVFLGVKNYANSLQMDMKKQ